MANGEEDIALPVSLIGRNGPSPDFHEALTKYVPLCSAHFNERCFWRNFSVLINMEEGNLVRAIQIIFSGPLSFHSLDSLVYSLLLLFLGKFVR